ncbi:MAG: CDP-diacylglycerol--serine O-phosphatidyltransferase [Thermoanaerobaculia bacterium]
MQDIPLLPKKKKPKKGIYVFPSILTIGSVYCGFFALIKSFNGKFEAAGLWIIIAAILDTLDGRIARLTKTSTDFGKELDSLADAISFGVVPSIVLYNYSLKEMGRAGILLTFLYLTCGIIRLARFNTLPSLSRAYFVGLPIPASASFIALSLILRVPNSSLIFPIAVLILSYLMVSTIPYPSFKELELKTMRPTFTLLSIVLLFLIVAFHPPLSLLLLLLTYYLSGPYLFFSKKLLKKRKEFNLFDET